MQYNSSEQTVSWFKQQYATSHLIIRPPYQRKPVWSAKQKCYLIDSILQKLPVPEICIQIATTPDGETDYAVVDGQQRIRSVLQFIGSDEDPDEVEFNKFTLDKLPAESPWRGMAFSDLPEDVRVDFYEYKFAVRYLQSATDRDVRDMFSRLNKYLTPLNAQELRHATYSGPFVQLVEKLADIDYWAEIKMISPAQIRRMKDLDFVSNLLIGVIHGPQGGAATVVDEYYHLYEDYDDEFPDQRRTKELFHKTLQTIKVVLPDIKDIRWGNITDFYTLFVALAHLLREKKLIMTELAIGNIGNALRTFSKEIDLRLGDENAKVSDYAIRYVRAVEKGANDKTRRATRHQALLDLISESLTRRQSK
jgi:hypothetical protein